MAVRRVLTSNVGIHSSGSPFESPRAAWRVTRAMGHAAAGGPAVCPVLAQPHAFPAGWFPIPSSLGAGCKAVSCLVKNATAPLNQSLFLIHYRNQSSCC